MKNLELAAIPTKSFQTIACPKCGRTYVVEPITDEVVQCRCGHEWPLGEKSREPR